MLTKYCVPSVEKILTEHLPRGLSSNRLLIMRIENLLPVAIAESSLLLNGTEFYKQLI